MTTIGRHRAADRGTEHGEVLDTTAARTRTTNYVPRHAAPDNVLIMVITAGEPDE